MIVYAYIYYDVCIYIYTYIYILHVSLNERLSSVLTNFIEIPSIFSIEK